MGADHQGGRGRGPVAIEAFADMPDAEYDACARTAWSTWSRHFNAEVNYPRFVTEVFAGFVTVATGVVVLPLANSPTVELPAVATLDEKTASK